MRGQASARATNWVSELLTFCDAVHVRADRVGSYRWVRRGLPPVENIILLLPTRRKCPEWDIFSQCCVCFRACVCMSTLPCACVRAQRSRKTHTRREWCTDRQAWIMDGTGVVIMCAKNMSAFRSGSGMSGIRIQLFTIV